MKSILVISCLIATLHIANNVSGQSDVESIINNSIQYHDPEGKLQNGRTTFYFEESRPSGGPRKSKVTIDPQKDFFRMERSVDGVNTTMTLKKNKAKFTLNGSSRFSDEEAQKHRLTKERLVSTRNYYRYLWMLPMTLRDQGTIIHEEYTAVDFEGHTGIEIKVTYDPEVGEDTWYFYFHPQTNALIGYRFYHNEADNDGEYILLSELTEKDGVRIPKLRRWLTHKEDKYLGADTLTKIEFK